MCRWITFGVMLSWLSGCGGGDAAVAEGRAKVSYSPPGGPPAAVRCATDSKCVASLLRVVGNREELLECAVDERSVKKMKAEHEYVELRLPALRLVVIGGKEEKNIRQGLFLFTTSPSDSDGVTVLVGDRKWWSGAYYGRTGRRLVLEAVRSIGLRVE
jgi:hypothetical protein